MVNRRMKHDYMRRETSAQRWPLPPCHIFHLSATLSQIQVVKPPHLLYMLGYLYDRL